MEWFNFFKKSELNESIIANEVFERNVQYISVMSIFWIPVNLFHIILFYLNLDPNKEIEYLWRMGIILSHLFLMIFFIAIGSIFNYYKRNNSFRKEVIQFLLYSVFFYGNHFRGIHYCARSACNICHYPLLTHLYFDSNDRAN